MDQKPDCYNRRWFEYYEIALKDLDKATEIALKLGVYPTEVLKMKELEMKELRHHFLNR